MSAIEFLRMPFAWIFLTLLCCCSTVPEFRQPDVQIDLSARSGDIWLNTITAVDLSDGTPTQYSGPGISNLNVHVYRAPAGWVQTAFASQLQAAGYTPDVKTDFDDKQAKQGIRVVVMFSGAGSMGSEYSPVECGIVTWNLFVIRDGVSKHFNVQGQSKLSGADDVANREKALQLAMGDALVQSFRIIGQELPETAIH